jgi:hypothetical protein
VQGRRKYDVEVSYIYSCPFKLLKITPKIKGCFTAQTKLEKLQQKFENQSKMVQFQVVSTLLLLISLTLGE